MFFSSAALAQSQTWYIPQVGAGTAQGLEFGTTITMVNLGTGIIDPARVDIETWDETGQSAPLLKRNTLAGPEGASLLQREIEGRGTAVVETYSEDGSLSLGWAAIRSEDSIAVEVVFTIRNAAGELVTTTSILPSAARDEATLLLTSSPGDGISANLAALNPPSNGETATVTAAVYDAFGIQVGTAGFDLEPDARVAQQWTELLTVLADLDGFVGTAEVTSNVPLILLPLRQDSVELTTQEPLPARE